MCKCNTEVTAAWADDWKKFTITIDSDKVKFRDFNAEKSSSFDFNTKSCRIGNEPIKVGNTTFVNTDFNSLGGETEFDKTNLDTTTVTNIEGGMFGDTTAGNTHEIEFSPTDVPLNTCGDTATRQEELKHISDEFGSVNIDHSTNSEFTSEGTSTGNETTPGSDFGFKSDELDFAFSEDGSIAPPTQTTTTTTTTTTIPVYDTSGYCPAHVEEFNEEDLKEMGVKSADDIYWYMSSLGTTFGDISEEMLKENSDPTEGLEFTTSPDSICSQLFDTATLTQLDQPTCTIAVVGGKTLITVTRGERSYISPGMNIKFQPNVFVEGCDFPVLVQLAIVDGASPSSLEISFSHDEDITICEDLFLIVESEGNIGDLSCMINIKKVLDASDNALTTEAVLNITKDIQSQNTATAVMGGYNVFSTDINLLYTNGVRKIAFEGFCLDYFGQEGYIENGYTLVTQSSGVSMAYDVEYIVYDTNFGELATIDFVYSDCSSGTTVELAVTYVLQKLDAGGAWVDTTSTAETIDDEFIPAGLALDQIYRIKISVITPGSSTPTEFFVRLEMVIYEPWVILDDFSAFLSITDPLEYEFTADHFQNVGALSEVTLSFSCTSCDNGECMGQAGALDINALYNNSNKTITVPANTFSADSCYEIEVSVFYKGMVGTNYGFIGTAGASESTYDLHLSIQDGEYRKPSKDGRID